VGRPLKPTALKLLAGNPGRRPLNKLEPKPAVGAAMPEYLLQIPAAVAHWQRVAPVLTELGVLTTVDGDAFARLCRMWAEDQADAAAGLEVDTKLAAALVVLEGRFGLTPSDRGKIKAAPPKPKSKLERYTLGQA
jgi:phage terminase small subunit